MESFKGLVANYGRTDLLPNLLTRQCEETSDQDDFYRPVVARAALNSSCRQTYKVSFVARFAVTLPLYFYCFVALYFINLCTVVPAVANTTPC